jgi:hypothetical protein
MDLNSSLVDAEVAVKTMDVVAHVGVPGDLLLVANKVSNGAVFCRTRTPDTKVSALTSKGFGL